MHTTPRDRARDAAFECAARLTRPRVSRVVTRRVEGLPSAAESAPARATRRPHGVARAGVARADMFPTCARARVASVASRVARFAENARAGVTTAPEACAFRRAFATKTRAKEAKPRATRGRWLNDLLRATRRVEERPERLFTPAWTREAEAARARVNPFRTLRHAGASRYVALTHVKTREYMRRRMRAVYARNVVDRPFATAMWSSVTKCVASDVFVQMAVEDRGAGEIDWNRVLSFFVLGVTYVGAFQYKLYNHALKPLLAKWRRRGYGTALSTGAVVAVDQALVQPFVYLPTFLCIKVVSEGETRLVDVPRAAFERWKRTGLDTMAALWMVWVPAQAINFVFVPKHLTIPWMNVVGTLWNGVLSYMHGDSARVRANADAVSSA